MTTDSKQDYEFSATIHGWPTKEARDEWLGWKGLTTDECSIVVDETEANEAPDAPDYGVFVQGHVFVNKKLSDDDVLSHLEDALSNEAGIEANGEILSWEQY